MNRGLTLTVFSHVIVGRCSRRLLLFLSVFVLLTSLTACSSGIKTDGPRLSFQEQSHNFGRVSASQKEVVP